MPTLSPKLPHFVLFSKHFGEKDTNFLPSFIPCFLFPQCPSSFPSFLLSFLPPSLSFFLHLIFLIKWNSKTKREK